VSFEYLFYVKGIRYVEKFAAGDAIAADRTDLPAALKSTYAMLDNKAEEDYEA
jgi:hypothetical protein